MSENSPLLPALITKAASKQTYYTIRFLVDHDRSLDAYRAYAYFRWLDNWLDENALPRIERSAFIERQQTLMTACYQSERPGDLTIEEAMLADLIFNDHEQNSGLQAYIENMMAVMVFDADRKGQLVSQAALDSYTQHLSVGVTEALHYFIGHDDPSPHTEARYAAVTAAHITHMLRDTFEDVANGYFNIPCEFLKAHNINPGDIGSDCYREWVRSRVALARLYFKAGKDDLVQVKNFRRRIAGNAYVARFEWVLDAIESDDYSLRADYSERKSLRAGDPYGVFGFPENV